MDELDEDSISEKTRRILESEYDEVLEDIRDLEPFGKGPVDEAKEGTPETDSSLKWKLVKVSKMKNTLFDRYLCRELGTANIPKEKFEAIMNIIEMHYDLIDLAVSYGAVNLALFYFQQLKTFLVSTRSIDGQMLKHLFEMWMRKEYKGLGEKAEKVMGLEKRI